MKIAVIYNKSDISQDDVINFFGIRNKEFYSKHIVEKVATSLEAEGHNVRIIDGNKDVIAKLQNFMPKVIMGEFPGMVFNMAYGIQGQSRYTHIPAMLEMMGVPYVGSGPAAHGIALDKVMTKIVFQRFGLPTPEYNVINGYDYDPNALEFPVIVKPRNESVSMGMKVVYNAVELKAAVDELLDNHIAVFVERFIPGREFAVGVLGNEPNLEILPVVEIGLGSPDAIQTYDNKMHAPMEKICPPNLSEEKMDEIRQLTRKAFNSLGLCDYARVDFRMDADGNYYLLEINSMASLGLKGSFFHAATVAGYTYEGLINKILDNASLRYFGSSYQKNPEISTGIEINKKLNKTAKIRRYIRSQMGTIEDYLEKFVAVSSNAYNAEGVNYLNKNISKILNQLGFTSTLYPQTEVGDMYYFRNHDSEKDDILLLAHSDTISDYQTHINLYREQNKIFGSGIAESKSGLALLLIALKSLKFTKSLKKRNIGILLMSDDTIGGHFSREIVRQHSQNAKKIIGLKNGNTDGSFTSSCSGKLKFRIDYSILDKGSILMKQYLSFLTKLQKLSSTYNVSVRIDKSDYNYISESNIYKSTIKVTIAFDSIETKDIIETKIKEYAKPGTPNISYNIKRLLNRKPLLSQNRNEELIDLIDTLAKKLEINASPSHRPTSSNICNIVENVPAVEGMGALGGNLRTGKEFILKDSLIDRAVLLSLLIDDIGE